MSRTAQRARIMERADRDARFKWPQPHDDTMQLIGAMWRLERCDSLTRADMGVLLHVRDKINAMLGDAA
jgi:hypothetical protein